MKTLKIITATGTLFLCSLFVTNANAALLFQELDPVVLVGDGTSFNQSEPGILHVPDSINLVDLDQFDPTMGTLTSVTLSIMGDLFYSASSGDFADIIDANQDHQIDTFIEVGIGTGVPLSGGFSLTPSQTVFANVSCSGAAGDPFACFGDALGSVMIDVNSIFSDADLAAFIGLGDLGALSLDLLAGPNSFSSVNLTGASVDIDLFTFDGVVSVEYEFSPVPLPAAAWFLISGLASLFIPKIRRRT